ncbi:unnamed protein product [Protopolystoma xenopodis]|uniref:Uncharacterized protein n=1 Tax=Protopolystoma xenopodis TaxID=117903 RepID=A0A448WMA6_9PLAT|nr:unnamed protein product [Protopolystoma xenopodis]
MISELIDPSIDTSTLPCINVDQPNEPEVEVAKLSRSEKRRLRLQIASLDIRLNELNESIYTCMSMKNFSKINQLTMELAELETEKSRLIQKIQDGILP